MNDFSCHQTAKLKSPANVPCNCSFDVVLVHYHWLSDMYGEFFVQHLIKEEYISTTPYFNALILYFTV